MLADLGTIWKRFWDDFRGFWNGKNEKKCGRVCSDSIFGVRNRTSIFGAFWARFWEGLGSILGGFWAPRPKNRHSGAVRKRGRKTRRKKSKNIQFSAEGRRNGGSRWESSSREPMTPTRPAPRRRATGGGGSHSPSGLTAAAPGVFVAGRLRTAGQALACKGFLAGV